MESYGLKSKDLFSAAMNSENMISAAMNAKGEQQVKPENVQDPNKCWNCGNDRHPKSQCPAKDVICYGCGKKGHFGRLCRNPKHANKATAASMLYPTLA